MNPPLHPVVRKTRSIGVCIFLLVASASHHAHELRPGYLEVQAQNDTSYQVLWKQPTRNFRVLDLVPTFPVDCSASESITSISVTNFVINRFQLSCQSTLEGREVGIVGLSRTLTDVYLRVELPTHKFSTLLRPEQPFVQVASTSSIPTFSYLWVGVEHLLLGFDHILFLLCLMYAVRRFGHLIRAVTAFTVAHSITLILSVLGWINMPQAPVEVVIALSILFFAYTAVRETHNPQSWHRSWLVIFGFGLIHGAGFATAISDTGLPQDDLLPALLLFNVGIELAQISLIVIILVLIRLSVRLIQLMPVWLREFPLSISGGVAVYFICSRTWGIFLPGL